MQKLGLHFIKTKNRTQYSVQIIRNNDLVCIGLVHPALNTYDNNPFKKQTYQSLRLCNLIILL